MVVIQPDWGAPVVERYAWLTDVQTSRNGAETTTALRDAPRRTIRYRVGVHRDAARALDAQAWGQDGASLIDVPLWRDALRLTAPVAVGAVSLPLSSDDLAPFEFRAGGRAIIIDGVSFEVVGVSEVASEGLVLASGTSRAWSAGSRVAPVRSGRLSSLSRSYETPVLALGEVEWEVEGDPVAGAASQVQYRGRDVGMWRPERSGAMEGTLTPVVERVDGDVGMWRDVSQYGRPVSTRTLSYQLVGRSDAVAFLRWLHWTEGRAREFWQSTWQWDLELIAPATAGASSIDVRPVGYAATYARRLGRRDVALWHRPTRRTVYRRILSATAHGAHETLELGAPLPFGGAASEWVVSWLELVRLDSDDVEIAWHRPELATVSLGVREVVVETDAPLNRLTTDSGSFLTTDSGVYLVR